MDERKLQFIEGTSSKFWDATLDDTTLTVVYGRIGTSGQSSVKTFGSASEAKKAYDKLVAEKLKKGYSDAEGSDASGSTATAPAAKAPAAAKPAKVAPKAAKATKAAAAEASAAESEPDETSARAASAEEGPAATTSANDAPAPSRAPSAPAGPRAVPEARLRLSQADLIAGLVEPIPLVERAPAQPFDRAACIERLSKIGKPEAYSYSLRWDRVGATPSMSVEEAWFWIRISTLGKQLKDLLKAAKSTDPKPLKEHRGNVPPGLTVAEYVAMGLDAYCDDLFAERYQVPIATVEWLIPQLNASEREALRDAIAARVNANPGKTWPTWVLAVLGMDAASVATQLAAHSPLTSQQYLYGGEATARLRMTFGLRDPAAIMAAIRHQNILPTDGADARATLAATGFLGVEWIADAVIAASTKDQAESLANALGLAEGPETVLPMFRVFTESKVPGVARQWLDAHAGFTVPALVPLVATQGNKADAAASYLREVVRAGHAELIEQALVDQPEHVERAVRAKVLDAGEEQHPVATDDELPDWAQRCFGDPAKLTVEPLTLTPEQENPPVRVDTSALGRTGVPPLPPYVAPPAPEPFDFEACLANVLALCVQRGSGQHTYELWEWHKLQLRLPMSPAEGRFWITAQSLATWKATPKSVEKKLRAIDFQKHTLDRQLHHELMLLPAAWADGGLEAILHFTVNEYLAETWTATVVEKVLPGLSPTERDRMRKQLLDLPKVTTASLLLAQRLGATDAEIRERLPKLDTSESRGRSDALLKLLFVYEDPETIVREATRLGALPHTEAQAREWLAATGLHGVPTLGAIALKAYSENRAALARVLSAVEAPEVAPTMLALRRTNAKEQARRWLEANIAHTVDGLLPLVGTKDKLAPAAVDHLRDLCRRGYAWLVEKRAGGRADVQKQVLDPRAGAIKPNAADHTLATRLAPLNIDTPHGRRAIGPERTAMLLAEVRSSSMDAPTPRLTLVRENVSEHARDAFAWAVFQSWLQDGAASKERWKMEVLGHLGGDASAIALAKQVRVWPGESQHQRAVMGLECLRAIGTDTALMQIHGISQKVSFKGIKTRAGECMEGIAEDRGMSRDELADRIIPDGGLDERGARVFDFGPRRFEFVLGDDLKPMVRDESGKRMPALPKPNSKDDAELAKEAAASWSLLKKQVAEVVKTQVVRLELAMVTGRRWSPEDLDVLFVRHPLMTHLVRRVIWGAYDAEDRLLASFRVADDGTLASRDDQTFDYPEGTTAVGVVHPSHLGAGDAPAWGEILSDYEIVPAFAQLNRPIYTLTDEERTGTLIKRFEKQKLVAKLLVFGLESLGWLRGTPQDGGGFGAHRKTFGAVTAVVTYEEGCWVGTNGDDWPEQTITGLGFIADPKRADDGFFHFGYGELPLPLADVSPVVVSEVLHDLTRLVEKGRVA